MEAIRETTDLAQTMVERISRNCCGGDVRLVFYVASLLQSLGVGRRYRGYVMAMEAICLAVMQEDALTQVRKYILEPVAQHYDCTWKSVDRNLRTAINCAWRTNAERMQELCAYPLQNEPSVAEFLSLMSDYVVRKRMCRTMLNGVG